MNLPSEHFVAPANTWDLAFVGMGASNGLLLHALHRTGRLAGKSVVIFEPRPQAANDKTYCFWAAPQDDILEELGHLVEQQWTHVRTAGQSPAALVNCVYCRVDAAALYAASRQIAEEIGATWLRTAIESDAEGQLVTTEEVPGKHTATRVFDSRTPSFPIERPTDVMLLQSFVGFKVRFDGASKAADADATLDASAFNMMDFGVPQRGATRFVYTLPYDDSHALLELTQFGEKAMDRAEGETDLAQYIAQHHPGQTYTIQDRETGVIPMTSVQPVPRGPASWQPTGTAAGMLKPSTGYAFKQMFAHAQALAESEEMRAPVLNRTSGRFAFYDHLLLLILKRRPDQGKPIFETLFRARSAPFVMRFLDERTRLVEEVGMFARLPIAVFLEALAVRAIGRMTPVVGALLLSLLLALGMTVAEDATTALGWTGLLAGMALVGIPHGALDAVISNRTREAGFYVRYLLAVGAVLAVWWWWPAAALVAFLIYSAWHFGETDAEHFPGLGSRFAFLWGAFVLAAVLFPHGPEVLEILNGMGVALPAHWGTAVSATAAGAGLLGLAGLALAGGKRSMAACWALLAVGCALPVWMTFGLYFIGVHSAQGWGDLRRSLRTDHADLFRQALPFNALSWAGLALLWWAWPAPEAGTATASLLSALFILIAGISLPHIAVMHRFYAER